MSAEVAEKEGARRRLPDESSVSIADASSVLGLNQFRGADTIVLKVPNSEFVRARGGAPDALIPQT